MGKESFNQQAEGKRLLNSGNLNKYPQGSLVLLYGNWGPGLLSMLANVCFMAPKGNYPSIIACSCGSWNQLQQDFPYFHPEWKHHINLHFWEPLEWNLRTQSSERDRQELIPTALSLFGSGYLIKTLRCDICWHNQRIYITFLTNLTHN